MFQIKNMQTNSLNACVDCTEHHFCFLGEPLEIRNGARSKMSKSEIEKKVGGQYQ